MRTKTVEINHDEQIMYTYEVAELRSIKQQYNDLLSRLKSNERMLRDLQDQSQTTAIYHTADGLAYFVRGDHSLPVVQRPIKSAAVWDDTPGVLKPRPVRTYRRGKDIETFNGGYAAYYEDASNNH